MFITFLPLGKRMYYFVRFTLFYFYSRPDARIPIVSKTCSFVLPDDSPWLNSGLCLMIVALIKCSKRESYYRHNDQGDQGMSFVHFGGASLNSSPDFPQMSAHNTPLAIIWFYCWAISDSKPLNTFVKHYCEALVSVSIDCNLRICPSITGILGAFSY